MPTYGSFNVVVIFLLYFYVFVLMAEVPVLVSFMFYWFYVKIVIFYDNFTVFDVLDDYRVDVPVYLKYVFLVIIVDFDVFV